MEIFFRSSRVLGILLAPSPHGPFFGGGTLTQLCNLEAGHGGRWAPNLVCPERGLNPGPPPLVKRVRKALRHRLAAKIFFFHFSSLVFFYVDFSFIRDWNIPGRFSPCV